MFLDNIPNQNSDCAIVCCATNSEFKNQLEITAPLINRYAKNHNIDFHILTKRKSIYVDKNNRKRFINLFNYYERILYLDCDIIVKEDAPNIFDYVHEDECGICNRLTYEKEYIKNYILYKKG